MTVVSLIPNNALCVSQEELAVRLERCAAQVRSGENAAELVGILEYAKQKVMT